ncbi:DUF262 domain-containing protein [Lentibacillus lipolyticus]|nr:DUF262 domain-containing protein [Lentibacillus lipolyticus]
MADSPDTSAAELIGLVDSKIDMVRTRTLDLSFNELLDMYENGELEISPEYQRLFRWSEEKQSRFIESLILEMPIPPIYVIEMEEGVYELIDGLQRLSSYLRFRGALEVEDNEDQYLRLTDCDIVEGLNGYTYNDLPKALQIKLKRNFIRVEIIRKGSDQRLRYYMFKRLNTGGEMLSEQEIRNSTIRLLDNTFNDFIIRMSENPNFRTCIEFLTDEKKEKKYDQEYVLKFFAFKNYRDHYKKNITPFLTDYMEAVSYSQIDSQNDAIDFNYDKEGKVFIKTFAILNQALGENAFARVQNEKFVVSLTPTHFEAFTMGIQKYLEQLDETDEQQMKALGNLIKEIKSDKAFQRVAAGGGKNTANFLKQRIEFVEEKVGEWLNGTQ